MNEHQKQWEDVAQTEDQEKYIATGWHVNKHAYEYSGIMSTGMLFKDMSGFIDKDKIKNMSIVEIGAGNGRMTKYLRTIFKKVYAVDCSETMIEAGKKRVRQKNVEWIVNDGNDLTGVKDNCADIVFSFITIHHMDKETIKAYFVEAARVLKEGGLFAFQLPIGDETVDPDKYFNVATWKADEIKEALQNDFEFLLQGVQRLDYHVYRKK